MCGPVQIVGKFRKDIRAASKPAGGDPSENPPTKCTEPRLFVWAYSKMYGPIQNVGKFRKDIWAASKLEGRGPFRNPFICMGLQ